MSTLGFVLEPLGIPFWVHKLFMTSTVLNSNLNKKNVLFIDKMLCPDTKTRPCSPATLFLDILCCKTGKTALKIQFLNFIEGFLAH